MQLGEINWGRQVLELKRRIGISLLFKAFERPLNNMSGMYHQITWRELLVSDQNCLVFVYFLLLFS